MLPSSIVFLLVTIQLISCEIIPEPTKPKQHNLHALPSFSKHIHHPGQDLIFGSSVKQHVTFFYALCDRHADQPRKNCALTIEPINRVRNQTKTCFFDLISKKKGAKIPRKFLLTRLRRNELIFVWKEGETKRTSDYIQDSDKDDETRRSKKHYEAVDEYTQEFLKIRIVHMQTCNFHETNVTVDEKANQIHRHEITALNVVAFSNGAEIFFRNELFCGRDKRCRITYDSKTHKFSKYVESLPIKYHVDSKIQSTWPEGSVTSPDRRYLVDSLSKDSGVVQLLELDGDEVEAHNYSWSIFDIDYRISALAYSTGYDQLTICIQRMSNLNLECIGSKDKLEVDLNLRSKHVRLLRTRSLSDGGFLVLIGYASQGVTDRFQRLDHIRIDSEGQIVNSYGVINFECQNDGSKIDGGFFEKKGFEYCYYINCVWPTLLENKTELDLNEYHWYFYGYCMPRIKLENIDENNDY